MSFKDIIGNDEAKYYLIESIKNNNIPHAYMFIGEEGIGKKLIALEYAKIIMCESNKTEACGRCKSCLIFDSMNHPDFFMIEPDGNNIKIEQIRNIKSNIYEKPIVSDKKVYIINDSQKMTTESQNSLLKILEEPPEYIVIILIVSNQNLILDTIKSRCNKVLFNKIDNNILKSFLIKNYNFENINDNILELFNRKRRESNKIKRKNLFVFSNR